MEEAIEASEWRRSGGAVSATRVGHVVARAVWVGGRRPAGVDGAPARLVGTWPHRVVEVILVATVVAVVEIKAAGRGDVQRGVEAQVPLRV